MRWRKGSGCVDRKENEMKGCGIVGRDEEEPGGNEGCNHRVRTEEV